MSTTNVAPRWSAMYGDACRKKSTNADGTDAGDAMCADVDGVGGASASRDDDGEKVSKLASRPWSMARRMHASRDDDDDDARRRLTRARACTCAHARASAAVDVVDITRARMNAGKCVEGALLTETSDATRMDTYVPSMHIVQSYTTWLSVVYINSIAHGMRKDVAWTTRINEVRMKACARRVRRPNRTASFAFLESLTRALGAYHRARLRRLV